jgi:hypothetical protein
MAEAPQNQIINPEIIKGPEAQKPSVDVEKAPSSAPLQPTPKESAVENTFEADAAAAVSLENTMAIGTPDQINVVGDSLSAKNIESWFTKSNEDKK